MIIIVLMWVVTHMPRDYPDKKYVARLWVNEEATGTAILMDTDLELDTFRSTAALEGYSRVEREPDDDPTIMETWIK